MKKTNSNITVNEVYNNINIDFNNKTIEITNKLSQAVIIPKGTAYETFTKIRATYPDYSVKVIKREVKKSKNSTSKITYKTMLEYLERVHPEDVAALEEMHDSVLVDKLTGKETRLHNFFEIKKWFMENYGAEIAA